jgi:hypothetical protein
VSRRILLLLIAISVLVVMMFAMNPGFAQEAKIEDGPVTKVEDGKASAKAGKAEAKAP